MQFLQVDRLYRALILLGLALCFPSTSVSPVSMVLFNFLVLKRFIQLVEPEVSTLFNFFVIVFTLSVSELIGP